jgi:hypothetical protein
LRDAFTVGTTSSNPSGIGWDGRTRTICGSLDRLFRRRSPEACATFSIDSVLVPAEEKPKTFQNARCSTHQGYFLIPSVARRAEEKRAPPHYQ